MISRDNDINLKPVVLYHPTQMNTSVNVQSLVEDLSLQMVHRLPPCPARDEALSTAYKLTKFLVSQKNETIAEKQSLRAAQKWINKMINEMPKQSEAAKLCRTLLISATNAVGESANTPYQHSVDIMMLVGKVVSHANAETGCPSAVTPSADFTDLLSSVSHHPVKEVLLELAADCANSPSALKAMKSLVEMSNSMLGDRFTLLDKIMPEFQNEVAAQLGISAFERLMHMPAIESTFSSGSQDICDDLINKVFDNNNQNEIKEITRVHSNAVFIVSYRRAFDETDNHFVSMFDNRMTYKIATLVDMIEHNHTYCHGSEDKFHRAALLNRAAWDIVRG